MYLSTDADGCKFLHTLSKSTSVKKECAKSKETPIFGAAAFFKNYKKIPKAKKLLVHFKATVNSMLK